MTSMFCKNCKHVNYKHLNSRSTCRIKDCGCPAFIPNRPQAIREVTAVEAEEMRRIEEVWFVRLSNDGIEQTLRAVLHYREYVVKEMLKGKHSEDHKVKWLTESNMCDIVISALNNPTSSLGTKTKFIDKRGNKVV